MLLRFLHTSVVNFDVKKQGSKLCKMLNPRSAKKWHPTYSEVNTLPSIKSLTKVSHEPGKRGVRRLAVLNKLFMKHITDLMSTGSSSLDIVGRGIEISKVAVSPDLQRVNVFWVCKGDGGDEQTESVLQSAAGLLRHQLSMLRLMGEVPYIVFVKDRQEARLVELARRLSVADYGEEYAPTEPGHLLKSEFTLSTKLSPEMKAKIKKIEESLPVDEEPVPEMSHAVYGVDRAAIVSRVLAARRRGRDAWCGAGAAGAGEVLSYRGDGGGGQPERGAAGAGGAADQRRELAEFLQRRQIEQNKRYKELRSMRNYEVRLPKPDTVEGEDIFVDEDEDDEYNDDDDSFLSRDGGGGDEKERWDIQRT